MIVGSPHWPGIWVGDSSSWQNADAETIARASVHKHMHYAGLAYQPQDVWQDPMAKKLCESVGTNLLSLKLRNFNIGMWILPSPTLCPTEPEEVSPTYMNKVASELLSHKYMASLIDHAKVTIPKANKTIDQLRKADLGLTLGTIGWMGVGAFTHVLSPSLSLLPLPVYLAGNLGISAMRSWQKTKILQSIANLNDESGRIVAKNWVTAALDHDFSKEFLVAQRTNGMFVEVMSLDVHATDKKIVEQLTERTEDWAERSPLKIPALQIQAQSSNPDLGTTTIGMIVFPPHDNPPRPPDRKVSRTKQRTWRPEWSWIPKPAPAG